MPRMSCAGTPSARSSAHASRAMSSALAVNRASVAAGSGEQGGGIRGSATHKAHCMQSRAWRLGSREQRFQARCRARRRAARTRARVVVADAVAQELGGLGGALRMGGGGVGGVLWWQRMGASSAGEYRQQRKGGSSSSRAARRVWAQHVDGARQGAHRAALHDFERDRLAPHPRLLQSLLHVGGCGATGKTAGHEPVSRGTKTHHQPQQDDADALRTGPGRPRLCRRRRPGWQQAPPRTDGAQQLPRRVLAGQPHAVVHLCSHRLARLGRLHAPRGRQRATQHQ